MVQMLKRSRAFEFVFLAWLLTLPFGSKIGGISLGYLTIYPNLLLSFVLIIPVVFTFMNWRKLQKVIAFFLLLWVLAALVYGSQIGFEKEVVFDLRSLSMQLIYCVVLFSIHSLLGHEKFTRILVLGLRCFLVVLLLFGLYEFYTGNHLEGTTTAKFAQMAVGMVFYAPTFVYDNPNDYMLYGMFVLLALTTFDIELRKRPFSIITGALILILFNVCSNSRLAFIGLTIIILFQAFIILVQNRDRFNWNKTIPLLISLGMMGLLFVMNPIFLGPKYIKNGNPYQYNDMRILSMKGDTIKEIRAFQYLSEEEKKKVREFKETSSVQYVRAEDVVRIVSNEDNFTDEERVKIEEAIPADQVRVNLIKNGIGIIRENPILGIGPGQFRKVHALNETENPTGTVIAPHNFIIELVSQYGVFGWGYLGFILYLFIRLLRNWQTLTWAKNLNLLLFFILLPLFWLMPSSYLYQDINWLLLPLLAILLLNIQIEPDGK